MADTIYSDPVLNNNYTSIYEYQGHSFNASRDLTDVFLDSVLSLPILPVDLANMIDFQDMNVFVDACVEGWSDIVTSNWRFLTAFTFGAAMVPIMVLAMIGFFIAACLKCCCCCFSSSSKKRPGKSNHNTSVCVYGTTMLLSMVMVVFGVAWYGFAANDLGHSVQNSLISSADAIIYDTNLFIDNTVKQIEHLTKNNTEQEFVKAFEAVIADLETDIQVVGNDILSPEGADYAEMTKKMEFLDGAVTNFIGTESVEIIRQLELAETSLEVLSDDVEAFKDMDAEWNFLSDTENNFCTEFAASVPPPTRTCEQILLAKDELVIDSTVYGVIIDALEDQVAALSTIYPDLTKITGALVEGEEILEDINGEFDLDELTAILDQLVQDLIVQVDSILQEVQGIQLERPEEFDTTQENIDEYGYVVTQLAIYIPSGILLISVLFLFLGCCCGAWGKAGGTARKSGANLLCFGTLIFLLVGFVFWSLTVVGFTAGGSVQRFGCYTLELKPTEMTEPLDREVDELIHNAFDNEIFADVKWNLTSIITDLAADKSLYQIAHFDLIYDVNNLSAWYTVYEVEQLTDDIRVEVVAIIDEVVKQAELDDTTMNLIKVAAEVFLKALQDSITDIPTESPLPQEQLTDMRDTLVEMETFSKTDMTKWEAVNAAVITLIKSFDGVSKGLTDSMVEAEDIQQYVTDYTTEDLSYEGLSLDVLVLDIIELASNAVDYIDEDGRDLILITYDGAVDNTVGVVDEFVAFGIEFVEEKLGKTEPVYHVYGGMFNLMCNTFTDTFNMAWAGLGLTLLFAIPMLISACCLECVFRKEGPIRERFGDEDGDGDGIVMMNVLSKSKKIRRSNAAPAAVNPVFISTAVSTSPKGHNTNNPSDFSPDYAGGKNYSKDAYEEVRIYKIPDVYKGRSAK